MNGQRCYAVPFHLHRRRGGQVGADAYFWAGLEKRFRVVLLVQPVRGLLGEPPSGCCRLPVRVDASTQAGDVEEVARLSAPGPRAPRQSLAQRLLGLLVPPKLLAELEGAGDASVPEEAQARSLARLIGRLEPQGRVLWAVFHPDPGTGALLPADEEMARVYRSLASRDRGYLEASRRAVSLCRGEQ